MPHPSPPPPLSAQAPRRTPSRSSHTAAKPARGAMERGADLLVRLGWAKHKVLLRALPLTLLCLLARLALELSPIGFKGVFATETVTPFTTASMFVVAIVLGGVLEDYKEAEKIPSDIVCALDALSDKVSFIELATQRARAKQQHEQAKRAAAKARRRARRAAAAAAAHGAGEKEKEKEKENSEDEEGEKEEEEVEVLNAREIHGELLVFVESVLEFLGGKRTEQDIIAVVGVFSTWTSLQLKPFAETSSIETWEILDIFDRLRESLARLSVIKRTTFIPAGQMLMKYLVFITVALVTLARYDNSGAGPDVPGGGGGRRLWSAALGDSADNIATSDDWFATHVAPYINVGTYSFLFLYVLFLIDDLEDPFEYSEASLIPSPAVGAGLEAHLSGSADVNPYPFLELYCRFACLAGRADITAGAPHGTIIGARPHYSLTSSEGALAPPRLPSECLAAAERDHDKPGVVAEREKYRALLQDATFTVLDNTRLHHEQHRTSGGESSPGGRGDAAVRFVRRRGGGNGDAEEGGLASPLVASS